MDNSLKKVRSHIVWAVALGLVLIFAFVLRFVALDSIPIILSADEYDNLRTVINTFRSPEGIWKLNWNGSSILNTYFIGIGWVLGGKTYASIKFASIIFSVFSILAFSVVSYKLTKSQILSVASTIALAGNAAFLNFSRSAWENIFNALPSTILAYYVLKIAKGTRLTNLDVAVISASLAGSFYFYHAGKIVMGVFVVIWVAFILYRKKWSQMKVFVRVAITTFALCLPGIVGIILNPIDAFDRIRTVSIFNQEHALELLLNNIQNNVLALFYWTNNNARYGALGDVFSFPVNILILLFVSFLLLKHRSLFLYFIFSFLLTQVFSNHTPDLARGVHLIPTIYLGIILGFSTMVHTSVSNSVHKHILVGIFCACLAFGTAIEISRYFSHSTKADTVKVRRPGIHMAQYDDWLQMAESMATLGKEVSLNADEWEILYKTRYANTINR